MNIHIAGRPTQLVAVLAAAAALILLIVVLVRHANGKPAICGDLRQFEATFNSQHPGADLHLPDARCDG